MFPDGQVPATAGAGPATLPWDRGWVEEDAPGQKEEAGGQRAESEGKETHGDTQRSLVRNWLKHRGPRKEDRVTKEQKCSGDKTHRYRLRFCRTKDAAIGVDENYLRTETRQEVGLFLTHAQTQDMMGRRAGKQKERLSTQERHTYRDQLWLKPVQLSVVCCYTDLFFLTFISVSSRRC